MVKRKPSSSSKIDEDQSDEYEATQSEDYITGTTDATEDEANTGISDSEHETTVLSRTGATRSPSFPSTSAMNTVEVAYRAPRGSSRLLQKKRHAGIDPKMDISGTNFDAESKRDSAGMNGMIKGAIQEMTSQIISAIQTAFRGNPTTACPVPDTSKNESKKKIAMTTRRNLHSTKRRRSPPPDSESSDSDMSYESGEDSDTNNESTSQIVQYRSRHKHNHSTKLPYFTGKEKWEVWHRRFEAVAELKG